MRYLMAISLLLTAWTVVEADGIVFHHGTWPEAMAKAKESGQLIFVDAYTTWCGPCKLMSAKTFPDKSVGEFYNANFINVKLDMEKGEGLDFSDKYGVSAFPTLLFIDGEGQLVMKTVGYMDPAKFLDAGRSALKKGDKSALYAKEYNAGKRDFNTVYNYVKALNQAGKSSLKIANEYINSQKDLSTPENLRFILESATEADSRIFDLAVKSKEPLIKMFGEEKVKSKWIQAGHRTVLKAIEFQTFDLLVAAQQEIRAAMPEEGDAFEFNSNIHYYTATKDAENLYKSMKKLPSSVEKDPDLINHLALEVEKSFNTDEKLTGLCEQLFSKIITTSSAMDHQFTLARIFALNGKAEKASKLLTQLIPLAKSKGMDTMPMEQFRMKLGS